VCKLLHALSVWFARTNNATMSGDFFDQTAIFFF